MHASVVIDYLLAKEKAFDPRFFLLHQKETIILFNMYESSLGSHDAFSPITPLVQGYIHLNSSKTFPYYRVIVNSNPGDARTSREQNWPVRVGGVAYSPSTVM